MERREPTLSPGALSEPAQPSSRRQQSYLDQDDEIPARPARKNASPAAPVSSASSSPLPAIALVVALAAVGGAGFLGWQLFQAQAQLKQADLRIQGLEQQLSLTSEESSASVVTLQSHVKKLDGELRRIADLVETNRKAIAATTEKTTAVGRDLANVQKVANDAKTTASSLSKEVTASKTLAEGAAKKIDGMTTSVSQQSKGVQELKERLDKMALEMTALDSLAARLRNHDEAISAIDEYRRSTNRELLQIKQQLNAAPK